MSDRAPVLSAVVVHWRNEEQLARLRAAWPVDDPRFELVVVDNSSTLGGLEPPAILVDEGRNLGFGGGVARGVQRARGAWILVLNPDILPLPGALGGLLAAVEGATRDGDDSNSGIGTAGIVPALEHPDGRPQHRWQLQPLPTAATLLLQTFFLAGSRGPISPPPEGTAIQQPAAAALALDRRVLEEVGGFDPSFFPAWFEDVDLARRLHRGGHRLEYRPSIRFQHDMGGSVPALGYGPFLWVYYRNLCRYLRKHHGPAAALAARGLLPLGMLLRLLLLPVRTPKRATGRLDAARGLLAVAAGALTGWRHPRPLVRRFSPEARP
ncbi:MAG: glycosyltransferase [Acidobacteriota bacterium]